MERAERFDSLEQALEEGKAYITKTFKRYRMPSQDWDEVMQDCLVRIWKDWQAGERIRLKILRRSLYPFKGYVSRDAVTGRRKAPINPVEDRFMVFSVNYSELKRDDPLLSIDSSASAELEYLGTNAALHLLDQLSEKHRRVVFLRFWLDWEHKDIGRALKADSRVPAALSHKYLKEALETLRETPLAA